MENKESFEISNSLFNDLFDSVCESSNNQIESVDFSYVEKPVRSFRSISPDILTTYEKKDRDFDIYQMETEKQRTRLACGYNTLYNGFLITKIITQEDPSLFVNMIHNKTQFWQFSRLVNKVLLKEQEKFGKERDCYPWSRKNIKQMIIERIYMEFLVKDSPTFHSIPDISRKLLENCFLWPDALENIQSKFQNFLDGEKKVNVFCMGALNHWFSLIINRYENDKVEVIVADSRNWTFFGLEGDELEKYIREKVEGFYKYFPRHYKIPTKEEMVGTYSTSLKEALDSVLLVIDCCTGKKNFIVEALDGGVRGILKQYVFAKHDIYMFMENFFQPIQIRQGLLNMFKKFKSYLPQCNTLVVFREWIQMAKKDLRNNEEKLPKFDFNSPTLSQDVNNELIWECMVKKEMERVKIDEKVPLSPGDVKNRDRMILVLEEFLQIMDSL